MVSRRSEPSSLKEGPSTRLGMVLVLALSAVVYFGFLESYPLLDPDEGRYAEIPREMVETGDYITPRLNYVKYFEKPPLFYWASALSMRLFGEREGAVRAVAGLTGLLTIFVVMGLGGRLFGPRAGVMAGWIYLTSALPLAMARLPLIDGLFGLCLSATWGAWWFGYRSRTSRAAKGWYCAAWACLGLAVMTKGIAALALTGAIVFPFLFLRRDLAATVRMAWWPGLPIFLVIALPWHVAAYLETPAFAHFYFVVQHFGRLVGTEHVKPFWFFPAVFPLTMAFWGVFFVSAFIAALRRSAHAIRLPRAVRLRIPAGKGAPETDKVAGEERSEAFLFLAIWVLAVIGLFSMSHSKLIPYILPACPAAALMLAGHLDQEGLRRPSARWCAAITAVILLALVPAVSLLAGKDQTLPPAQAAVLTRMLQAGFLAGGLLVALSAFRTGLIPAAVGLSLLLTLPALAGGVQAIAKYRKIGALVKAMPSPLPREIRIAEWKTYDRSLNFYTRRRIILVDEESELGFGRGLGDQKAFFPEGRESILALAGAGPLLVNLNPEDWPEVKSWGLLRVAAANDTNILVGNEAFFDLTNLKPWPTDAVKPPPRLLMPQREAGVGPRLKGLP